MRGSAARRNYGKSLTFKAATNLTPDILSPRAGNSIAASEMAGRREVIREWIAPNRRNRRSIAAVVLLTAAIGLLSAPVVAGDPELAAHEADVKARDADVKARGDDVKARGDIDVQGNRRID